MSDPAAELEEGMKPYAIGRGRRPANIDTSPAVELFGQPAAHHERAFEFEARYHGVCDFR